MSAMATKEIDELSGTETTGHEWDGIKELNTPLPRWWLWTFYGTIIFSVGYVIAYPACR
jgi:cytochrome c oxidase cbb3-type subunit III